MEDGHCTLRDGWINERKGVGQTRQTLQSGRAGKHLRLAAKDYCVC